ncbi:MAG: SEC-C domain-containing protein [Candidatus Sabulitectum sp.]|nr:SEC-C domain-containing protein [Candidatus Sabulitectum sp.]
MLTPKTHLLSKCLCGSGRKYKNCCWRTEKRTYAIARESIRSVHEKLNEILEKEDEGIRKEVNALYFEELTKNHGEEVVHDFIRRAPEVVSQNEFDSALSDYRFPDGTSLIDRFLEDHRETLHPAAVEYLESYRNASYSLYEVTAVIRGSHFEVTDLLSRKTLTITEKSATEQLTKWNTFFFRFAQCRGENLMTGLALDIPRMELDYVIDSLRVRKKYFGKSKTWANYLKKDWVAAPQLWANIHGVPRKMPILQNTDHEMLKPITIHYNLKEYSRPKAMKALDSISEITVEDDGFFTWDEERPKGKVNPILIAKGIFVSDSKLTVDINSEERCRRLGDAIEEVLGNLIIESSKEYHDIDMSKTSKKKTTPGKKLDVPKEVMAQVYADLYRNWPDENMSALDGKTPREAVKDKFYRKKVVNLLKMLESSHASDGDQIDFLPLWKDLGLKRPE